MSQGVLSFKYEEEKSKAGMTALGGLPVYMDMAHVMGLSKSVTEHIGVRRDSQGWTDAQMVTALIMLNLAGGDHVDDLRVLEGDEGFCRILRRVELNGLRRKDRRELERRWRKEKKRSVPSPSAVFRYLEAFHDTDEEKKRQEGKAFIPAENEYLQGFSKVNGDFLSFVQANRPKETATLDMDATLVETNKDSAMYCYKGFKAYQPLNTWWAEQGVIVHTEFRDGNVPAGFEQLRVLIAALGLLPQGVNKVRVRSDTAAYQHDLMKYCARGKNERFGVIEFALGCDVTQEFRKAVAGVAETDWKALYKVVDGRKEETGTEWAEVCFVPNAIGHSKNGPEYRYIAKRRVLQDQQSLPGMDEAPKLPFPTMEMKNRRYKIFGIVTNMDWEGGELLNWHHERCGKSEEAHSVMKEDLACGKLPSDDFGENAAWWWVMVLALNLNAAMKVLAMGESWAKKRMKAIRFNLINLPARIVDRSNSLWIRLSENHPSLELLLSIRNKIAALVPAPSG